jgi:hypothetical protein
VNRLQPVKASTMKEPLSPAAAQVPGEEETEGSPFMTVTTVSHLKGPESRKLYFPSDLFVKRNSRARYSCGSQRTMLLTGLTFISHCDVFRPTRQGRQEAARGGLVQPALCDVTPTSQPSSGSKAKHPSGCPPSLVLPFREEVGAGVWGRVFSLDKLCQFAPRLRDKFQFDRVKSPAAPGGCPTLGETG